MPDYSIQSDHPLPVIKIILVNDHGEVLLTRRAVEPYRGMWMLPSGRIRVDDDCAEAAAARTVQEETGLTVQITHLVDVIAIPAGRRPVDPRFFVVEVIFLGKIMSGSLTPSVKISEFQWLSLSRAMKETLGFNHQEILKAYDKKKNNLIPIERTRYTEWYGKVFPYPQSEYPRFGCKALVLNEKKEILLAHRAQYPYAGYWDLPGGHMKVDESIEGCLKREVKEELGVDSDVKDLFGLYSDKGLNPKNADAGAFYFVRLKGHRFIKNIEMDGFKYFPLDALPKKIAYHNEIVLEDLKKKL